MRYYYDCEFIEDGSTIDLISIGIVADDGRELYLQSIEFDEDKASDWVKENVLRDLPLCPCCGHKCNHEGGKCRSKRCMWRTREQIKQEILVFMDIEKYGTPELWGYYSAYDHVAFCQLFGTMMDLPNGFPMYTRDLKQWCDALGGPDLPGQGKGEHNALQDAKWNQLAYTFLDAYACVANEQTALDNPTLRYDRLSELVHIAVGEASMCWHELPHGVFDDERARDVADKLIQDIRNFYKDILEHNAVFDAVFDDIIQQETQGKE